MYRLKGCSFDALKEQLDKTVWNTDPVVCEDHYLHQIAIKWKLKQAEKTIQEYRAWIIYLTYNSLHVMGLELVMNYIASIENPNIGEDVNRRIYCSYKSQGFVLIDEFRQPEEYGVCSDEFTTGTLLEEFEGGNEKVIGIFVHNSLKKDLIEYSCRNFLLYDYRLYTY